MSLSSHNWFKYINEVRLNEGVRDIGLPEVVIDRIEATLPDAAEKAKTWMGNQWKLQRTGDIRIIKNLLFIQSMGALVSSGVFEDTDSSVEVEEGDSENVKKVKYQIQNLSSMLQSDTTPLGKYDKAFKKILRNLSKFGVDSETVEKIQELFKKFLIETYEMKLYGRYPQLFAMLNLDPTYYEEIKDFAASPENPRHIIQANERAIKILGEIEDPDQVLMEFPDGSYWYDLQSYSCPLEADRMGHCGSDDRASTLISLRKKDKKQKESKSFVTVSYEEDESTIYQIKGRQNSAPPEATWSHIADLIDKLGVTQVKESGEHSNDVENFKLMNDYLRDNTQATIQDTEQMWEDMEERLQEIEQNAEVGNDAERNILVTAYGYNVPDDVFDANEPFYDAYSEVMLEIDLGWPDVELSQGAYRSANFAPIPEDGWGSIDRQNFLGTSGIDDVVADIPTIGYSDNSTVGYEVEMREGISGEETAHLIITIQSYTDISNDTDDYEYYLDQLTDFNDESNVNEVNAKVRANLVENDYAKPNPWENSKKALIDLEESGELKNFLIVDDAASIDFIFRDPKTEQTAILSELTVPATLLPYIQLQDRKYFDWGEGAYLQLAKEMFKGQLSSSQRYTIDSDLLNSHMLQQLNFLYRQFQRSQQDPRQQQLPFGAKYRRQTASLPQDVQVQMSVKPKQERGDRTVSFEYVFKILVNSRSSQKEIDETIKFLRLLDANPEFVTAAAEEILDVEAGELIHNAKLFQQQYNSSEYFNQLYSEARAKYEAAANEGNSVAQSLIRMLEWFRENFNEMSAAQRYVTFHIYLEPMAYPERYPSRRAARAAREGELDAATGKPGSFDNQTRAHIRSIGGHAPEIQSENIEHFTKSMHRVRMEENFEDKLHRIDKLLNEADPNYDLRIYKITIGCTVADNIGGSEAETAAEIRGIAGVTTVRPVADFKKRTSPQAEYIPFEIKFELLGPQSRVKYRDEVLFPAMRNIKGLNILDWSSIHRTNIQGTIRTVRESYGGDAGGFGGLGGGLAAAQMGSGPSAPRAAPVPTVDDLIADWSEGGVQMYDHPTDTTNMAYHVMMPVEELWQYCDTHYRGDQVSFDGNYQDFIASGAQSPVYLAIGKNGRAKITGNEDIVWFAKKSGLEEVPVFISYQRQV